MFIDACCVQATSKLPSAKGIASALAHTNETLSSRCVQAVSVSPTAQYSAPRSKTVTRQPIRFATSLAGPPMQAHVEYAVRGADRRRAGEGQGACQSVPVVVVY